MLNSKLGLSPNFPFGQCEEWSEVMCPFLANRLPHHVPRSPWPQGEGGGVDRCVCALLLVHIITSSLIINVWGWVWQLYFPSFCLQPGMEQHSRLDAGLLALCDDLITKGIQQNYKFIKRWKMTWNSWVRSLAWDQNYSVSFSVCCLKSTTDPINSTAPDSLGIESLG